MRRVDSSGEGANTTESSNGRSVSHLAVQNNHDVIFCVMDEHEIMLASPGNGVHVHAITDPFIFLLPCEKAGLGTLSSVFFSGKVKSFFQ